MALLNRQQVRLHAEFQVALQSGISIAHGDFPANLGRSDLQEEKTSCNVCTASRLDNGKTEGARVQPQWWPAAAVPMKWNRVLTAHSGPCQYAIHNLLGVGTL